jgi:type IV secretory pathway protease TraF
MTLNVMNMSAFLPLALAQALLATSATLPALAENPPVIINETISMAKGAYIRLGDADEAKQNHIIALPMNEAAQAYLGEDLGYPKDIYLVKRIAGVTGDVMCRHDGEVTIGALTVHAARRDTKGNLLPYWQGCYTLLPNQVFLLGDHPNSFDSRYFGPVMRDRLIGRYQGVMTW